MIPAIPRTGPAPDFPTEPVERALARQAAIARIARRRRRHAVARAVTTTAICALWLPWLAGPIAPPAAAQATQPVVATQPADPSSAEAFASENAILDTAIPFAIGARQADAALRGSFGWPTFQEGLVEGVYFRFDPDGYARFAPTPRLDRDVFEVICRPRTTACVGRKGSMTLILTARGELQIQLEDIRPGDRFFVAEGVTEIELPETILAPLEPQMELLLAAGGDLVVKRGEAEADRISLTGLYPVGAYLRWVAARQDHAVLPRGWPVPTATQGSVTTAVNWSSPMPQPQAYPQTGAVEPPEASQTVTVPDPTRTRTQAEVAEVRGELRVLRELLVNRAATTDPAVPPAPQASPDVTARIAELQQAARQIQADLARLQGQPAPPQTQAQAQPTTPPAQAPNPGPGAQSDLAAVAAALGLIPTPETATQPATAPVPAQAPQPAQHSPNADIAARLQYLIADIGLDPKTALMVLEMAENKNTKQTQTVEDIINEIEPQKQNKQKQYKIIAKYLKQSIE